MGMNALLAHFGLQAMRNNVSKWKEGRERGTLECAHNSVEGLRHACKIHAYEMAPVRSTPMRDAPVRDAPMGWLPMRDTPMRWSTGDARL
jgi:hypothetical protein